MQRMLANWPRNDWSEILKSELTETYFIELAAKLEAEYVGHTIYPAISEIFTALNLTSYEETRLVIIGQDPYHGVGQAHGLAFSVKEGETLPPSLRNIFRELNQDLGLPISISGNLTKWAKQGVLLLNTILTVREGQPNSHQKLGWEQFTDRVIDVLNKRQEPIIFILWGRNAQAKAKQISASHHYILSAAHPSPLSAHRGFFGSRHFSQANEILRELGEQEIDWRIE